MGVSEGPPVRVHATETVAPTDRTSCHLFRTTNPFIFSTRDALTSLSPEEDPSFPKGCLAGCELREAMDGRKGKALCM